MLLLSSIIDSIGSYYRGNKTFVIKVDGKDSFVNSEGNGHYKILNSCYFGLNLTEALIKEFYNSVRNKLSHNATVGKEAVLTISKTANVPISKNNDGKIVVNLNLLYDKCACAVESFLKKAEEDLPKGKLGDKFH